MTLQDNSRKMRPKRQKTGWFGWLWGGNKQRNKGRKTEGSKVDVEDVDPGAVGSPQWVATLSPASRARADPMTDNPLTWYGGDSNTAKGTVFENVYGPM